jgi:alginate lyase
MKPPQRHLALGSSLLRDAKQTKNIFGLCGQLFPKPFGSRRLRKGILGMQRRSVRHFYAAAAGVFAAALARSQLLSAHRGTSQASGSKASAIDLAAIERKRVLNLAQRYLEESPITITSYTSSRSTGGKHDYFSEADYWWPNPKDPDGRYVRRDGMSNPDNFTAHRHALIRLSLAAPALAAAWLLTKNEKYAAHAAQHLRAWFLEPATLMNPSLQYAQAIKGRVIGRGTGIIDTIHLVEVARAISSLANSKALGTDEHHGLRKWFADYLTWMTTSPHGEEERDKKNNHSTCWVMQVAEFGRLTRNQKLTAFCRERFKTVLVPDQIADNGSFPQELRRTKPYSYCIFNLDAMATVCQILATPEDNLWTFTLPDGRGMGAAMAFMYPLIADRKSWPYAPDVEYFDEFPVRQPSLLFAGLALSRPEYIEAWRTLNPDPSVEEVIRNYPIRQPLLWVSDAV